MKTFLAACLSLTLISASAYADEDEASPIEVANAYLNAYSTFDTSIMAPFYADDAVFYDPTSSKDDAGGAPIKLDGKAAILKELSDYAAQFNSFSLSYDVKQRYHANGVVVFIADLTWSLVDKEDNAASGGAPIVTAITVKDGKVTRHVDYYDYQGNAVDAP